MKFNEEKFTDLVKQNRKKRTLRSILVTVLTVLLTLIIVTVPYLRYYNYGIFQGDKMSGVPDGQLKLNQEDLGFSGLIFEDAASYRFNVEGKKIAVKAHYYEKDKLVKSLDVATLEFGENSMMSGTLTYGVETDNEGKLVALKSRLISGGARTIINQLDLAQFKIDDDEFLASANSPFLVDQKPTAPYKVSLKRPIVIKSWLTSNVVPADPKGMLASEFLKSVPQAVFITLEFE